MCRHFRENFGLQTRVARFHNVFGPFGIWESGREKAPAAICRKVIAAAITGKHEIEIWGDGTQTRSFMYIDDCLRGIDKIMHSAILEPINLGSSELVTINQLVEVAEDIAGVKLNRRYNLDAPRGVAGRNSDNTLIRRYLGWEPDTKLREGMEKTYRWILEEFRSKYSATTAHKSQVSVFTKGSHPIPGEGFNPASGSMDTWRKGIPAGYDAAAAKREQSSKHTKIRKTRRAGKRR